MNRNRRMKRKKTAVKAVSMTMAAMLASAPALGAVPAYAKDEDTKAAEETKETEANAAEETTVTNGEKAQQGTEKEETVYINADASGKANKTTVSAHLINRDQEKTIADSSTLENITNVKGDQTFTQDGNNLTWDADGSDIYYEGTTNAQAPVSVSVTYLLDGKEMKPEELAGKSGKLTMKVHYNNTSQVTVDVDGTQQTVTTPFLMMTGIILPEDTFSNVTIDHGRILDDGSRNLAVGYGMPGLADSLKLSEIGDANLDEINLNAGFELTADVKDFSLNSTFTVALCDLFSDLDTDDVLSLDDFNDSISKMQDAGVQLVDGSQELFDGATLLDDRYGDLNDGINALKSGIDQLASGSNSLSGGLAQYVNGVNTLANGVTSYTEGASQLQSGAKNLSAISDALTQVQNGTKSLREAFDGEGTSQDDLVLATQALAAGTKQLSDALGQVDLASLKAQLNDPNLAKAAQNLKDANSAISQLNGLSDAFAQVKTQMAQTSKELSTLQGTIAEQLNNAYKAGYGAGYATGAAAQAQALIGRLSGTSLSAEQKQEIAALAGETAKTTAGEAASAAGGQTYSHSQEVSSKVAKSVSDQLSGFQTILNNVDGTVSNMSGILDALNTLEPTLQQLEGVLEKLPSTDLNALASGVSQLNSGAQALSSTVSGTLAPKITELNGGVSQLSEQASGGIDTLQKGLDTLVSNNSKLTGGAKQLTEAGAQLTGGSSTLISGVQSLSDGANQLRSGSGQVQSGLDQLASGAGELNDGLKEFNEEAIQKMADFFDGDLSDLIDRVKALKSDEASYTSFSGAADGMDGSVKFLIETDAIGVDD